VEVLPAEVLLVELGVAALFVEALAMLLLEEVFVELEELECFAE